MIRTIFCWLLAVFFILAGLAHFAQTAAFASIVPPALPFKMLIVQITGAAELILAVGLLVPKWRRAAGWALAAYCLLVLPANIYMAITGMPLGSLDTSAALWGRVLLQFPLIALILWASGALWPRTDSAAAP